MDGRATKRKHNLLESIKEELTASIPRWLLRGAFLVLSFIAGGLLTQYQRYSSLIGTVDALTTDYPKLQQQILNLQTELRSQTIDAANKLVDLKDGISDLNTMLRELRAELRGSGILKP